MEATASRCQQKVSATVTGVGLLVVFQAICGEGLCMRYSSTVGPVHRMMYCISALQYLVVSCAAANASPVHVHDTVRLQPWGGSSICRFREGGWGGMFSNSGAPHRHQVTCWPAAAAAAAARHARSCLRLYTSGVAGKGLCSTQDQDSGGLKGTFPFRPRL
jgi:hypothetical protein